MENITTPIPEVPIVVEKPKTNYLNLILISLCFVLFSVGVYYLGKQSVKVPETPVGVLPKTTTVPTKTVDLDPTANWKTYLNNEFGFTLKYPSTWENQTDSLTVQNGNKEFRLKTDKNEFINGTVFNQSNLSEKRDWIDEIKLKNNNYLLITHTDNLGPGSKPGVYDTNIFDQILSTFKFTESKEITPTKIQTTIKSIKYELPSNWLSVRDNSQLFEVGYNPLSQDIKMTTLGIEIKDKISNPNQVISNLASYSVVEYNNGSHHTFLYSYFGGKLTNQDKFPDYKEVEYWIGGKNCLFLDGISYSQFPTVWGMCPISSSKALLITTWDRENYSKNLSTLKFKI